MELLLAVIAILATLYWYLTKNYNYWQSQNVPVYQSKLLPGFGHILPLVMMKDSFQSFALKLYKSTESSMIGFYFLGKAALLVRDPELVKSVAVTNFRNFQSNLRVIDDQADPIMSKNPFFAPSAELWKRSRQRTTSHLSRKKLKTIGEFVKHVCTKMCDYVNRKMEGDSFECELGEHFTRYTGEIVANTAFAIEGQSFEDNPDALSFTVLSKNVFEPTLFNGVKLSLLNFAPDLARFFRLTYMTDKAENFFRDNIRTKYEERLRMENPPNDFLQLIIGANPDGDLDSIVADALIFHLDVYETSSIALSSVFYQLSLHQDVQEKLREYIGENLEESGGDVTYESLKSMDYLDQVIHESLRTLTPLSVLLKVCNKDTILQGPDGVTALVKEGQPVFISTSGLHDDSRYWPDPRKFDPDRFSLENQASRVKCTFMGFAEGPRKCVGMRLGMMILKMALVMLLTKYSVEHSPRTKVPFEFEKTMVTTYVKGGLWAKFKKLD